MRAPCFRCGLAHPLTYTAGPGTYACFTCRRPTATTTEGDTMTTGTRVRHDADGALGTVTGTTRYVTGDMVPQVRWDDWSSVRTGSVTIVDQDKAA